MEGRDGVQGDLDANVDKPRLRRSWMAVWVSSLVASCAAAATGFATELRYSLLAWIVAVGLIFISAVVTAVVAVGLPREWWRRRRWRVWAVLGATCLLVSVLLVVATARSVCIGCRTFDFETGEVQGWDVRVDGGERIGDRARATGEVRKAGRWSLAFEFTLHPAGPLEKAQIKVEGVPCRSRLSAWIYAPPEVPMPLVAYAYVLEKLPLDSGRDQWVFHKTDSQDLKPGKWTRVQFEIEDFRERSADPAVPPPSFGWRNPPLLLGFEIRAREAVSTQTPGTVFLDEIEVQ